jgi:hypothetical protein
LDLSAALAVVKGLKASLLRKQGTSLCVENLLAHRPLLDCCFLKSDALMPLGLIGANPASTVFYPRLSAFIIAKNRCFFIPCIPCIPAKGIVGHPRQ